MKNMLFAFMMLSTFVVSAEKRFKIIGYLSGDEPFVISQIDAKRFTHLNYTFASVVDGKIALKQNDTQNLIQLIALKTLNPDLKLMLSIGGPEGSDGFSEAAQSEYNRNVFAESIMNCLQTYGLDGVEIHWNMKPQGKFLNAFNKNDQNNYGLLLQTLRKKLDEQSRLEKRRKKNKYLLSVSGSNQRQYLFHSRLHDFHAYVDYINLQTFNYKVEVLNAGGVSASAISGHHSSLYPSYSDTWMKMCVHKTAQEYIQNRIPSRKVLMGIPFYGQGWMNAYEENDGLYQMTDGIIKEIFSYKSIQEHYLSNADYRQLRDKQAKAPYLYNYKDGTFISYEDKKSIRQKTRYLRRNRMGGVVINALYQDDEKQSLLRVTRRSLRRIAFPYFFIMKDPLPKVKQAKEKGLIYPVSKKTKRVKTKKQVEIEEQD